MDNQLLRDMADLGEDEREEIRLALVMTGGSSLAVWMGGVTNEVNRLRLGDGPYGEVLKLMHATARVDVISGTSAGGLNGAIMGMAIARKDSSLESLRTLWQDAGSFENLFRDPFQADPPSLLQGDAYFLKSLRTALEDLASGTATPVEQNPVDLMMTGSLLVGRDSASPDDFGSLVVDSDHKALFRFRRGGGSGHVAGCSHHAEVAAEDDFAGKGAAARLALAARSSASFPVVFEPSFVPIGDDDATPDRPDMRCNANFRTSRFVLDGGVLMNKPIEPALRAVFELPAKRQVRRVLAYVVPDPGERVIEEKTPEDETPTVLRVALDSLVTLPRNESVAGELAELKRHNDRARLQRDTRFQIVIALQRLDPGAQPQDEEALEDAAARLYEAYVSARVKLSVDRILGHLADGLNDALAASDSPLWNLEHLRSALEKHRRTYLPETFPSVAELQRERWEWGVQTLEHVGAVVMDLLRRPLRMTNPRRSEEATTAGARALLMSKRQAVHEALVRVRWINDRAGPGFWRARAATAAAVLSDETGARVDEWAELAFREWPGGGDSDYSEADARRELGGLALDIARALADSAGAIATLTAPDAVLPGERAEARTLSTVMQTLVAQAPDVMLRKLLALHVVETVFAPGSQERELVVELIQISGNTPNGFDGRSKAAGKVAGVKLGHFAAFYKRSWRANDWMWGRLDGAYRLAQVLLDPARIRQLEYGAAEFAGLLDPIVLGPESSPERAVLATGERAWDRAAAEAELSFLDPRADGSVAPLPASLPLCTRALARRIQLGLLCAELPNVGSAIEMDEDNRAYEAPETLAFAREVRTAKAEGGGALRPSDAVKVFPMCTVGDESVTNEMHSDLFTATASKAAAVVTSVGQGSRLGIAAVRGAFKFVRGFVIAIYLMAQSAVRGGAFGYGAMVLALAVGAILVAGAVVDDGGNDAFLTAGVALVGAGFLLAAVRSHAIRALWALGFTTLVVLSPELLSEIGDWLEAARSTWAAERFEELSEFLSDNRAVVIMAGLFLGPFLLGVVGRSRRLEAFAQRKRLVATLALAVVLGVSVTVIVGRLPGDRPQPSIVAFEFAGTAERVEELKAGWSATELERVEVLTAQDYAFIVLYVAAISSGVSVAAGLWATFRKRARWRDAGRLLAGAVVVAGLFDAVENVVLFRLLGTPVDENALPGLLWVLAATKFAIIALAALYVVTGVYAGVCSLVGSLIGRRRPAAGPAPEGGRS